MNSALLVANKIWRSLSGRKNRFRLRATTPPRAFVASPLCHPAAVQPPAANLPCRRPLRIVRIMECDQPASQVGRMVISGRMADVCAELDRLAACEAAAH